MIYDVLNTKNKIISNNFDSINFRKLSNKAAESNLITSFILYSFVTKNRNITLIIR